MTGLKSLRKKLEKFWGVLAAAFGGARRRAISCARPIDHALVVQFVTMVMPIFFI